MDDQNNDNDEPVDSTEDTPNFFEMAVHMARVHGHIVLEVFQCRCGNGVLMGHKYEETMDCPHCNARMPSKAPRPPEPGEVTLEHVVTAIETLATCYTNALNATPPVETGDWASLDPLMRLIINQTATRLVVAALKQVNTLAIGLAEGKQ